MKLNCNQCGKVYTIDRSRYPDKGGQVACKACDGRMTIPPISQETSRGPLRTIVCPNCSKRYSVPEANIPAHRKQVTCQVCGCDMPLHDDEDLLDMEALVALTQMDDQSDEPRERIVQPSQEDDKLSVWGHRWWIVGAGAGTALLLLVLCAYLMGGNGSHGTPPYIESDSLSPSSSSGHESSSGVMVDESLDPTLGKLEPYAMANVNLTRIATALVDINDLPLEASLSLVGLQQLGLEQASLYVFPDESFVALPGFILDFESAEVIKGLFSEQGAVGTVLDLIEESTYALNTQAITGVLGGLTDSTELDDVGAGLDMLPLDRYMVWLHDKQAYLMPDTVVDVLKQDPDVLSMSQVHTGAVSSGQMWAELFVFVPEDMEAQWKDAVTRVLKENVQAPESLEELMFIIDMFEEPVTSVLKHISAVKAVQAMLSEQDGKQGIELDLHFRESAMASKVHDKVADQFRQMEQSAVDSQGAGASYVLMQPWVHHDVTVEGAVLKASVIWEKQYDSELVTQLIKSSMAHPEVSGHDWMSDFSDDVAPEWAGEMEGEFGIDGHDDQSVLEIQGEVINVLQDVYEIRIQRPNLYGEDLAGLYYLANSRGEPLHLLEQSWALSDPRGARRFGYSVVPYEGYYLTVLPRKSMTPERATRLLRSSAVNCVYARNRWKALSVRYLTDVVAWPASGQGVAFVMTRDGLYSKHVTDWISVLPDHLEQDGWQKQE